MENMAPLMVWADAAVSAGGTTVWELAFMGLPAVLCITADNQEGSVNALGKDRVALSFGWIKDKSSEELSILISELIKDKHLREKLHANGRLAVDGKGVERITGLFI